MQMRHLKYASTCLKMPRETRAKSDSEIYHIQVTQEQKEELARRLLNVKAITFREIAELCNPTVYKVSEIKKLKNA